MSIVERLDAWLAKADAFGEQLAEMVRDAHACRAEATAPPPPPPPPPPEPTPPPAPAPVTYSKADIDAMTARILERIDKVEQSMKTTPTAPAAPSAPSTGTPNPAPAVTLRTDVQVAEIVRQEVAKQTTAKIGEPDPMAAWVRVFNSSAYATKTEAELRAAIALQVTADAKKNGWPLIPGILPAAAKGA